MNSPIFSVRAEFCNDDSVLNKLPTSEPCPPFNRSTNKLLESRANVYIPIKYFVYSLVNRSHSRRHEVKKCSFELQTNEGLQIFGKMYSIMYSCLFHILTQMNLHCCVESHNVVHGVKRTTRCGIYPFPTVCFIASLKCRAA